MYVPSQEVGIVDATFVLSNGAPWEHLEETLDAAAAKPEMDGVFVNIKEELVSSVRFSSTVMTIVFNFYDDHILI